MVARGVVPTPAEFDKVRTYLEYEAAQLPSARGLLFSVSPEVEGIFGKAPAGAFASERGLIEYALDFANGDAMDLPDSDPRVMTGRIFNLPGGGPEHLRGRLKRFLSQLRADRKAAQRWVTRQLPDIWVLPRCERTASGIGLHFHVLLRSPEALEQFVFLLLADESRGNALCQCTFEGDGGCKRFFLETPKGRGTPRRLYCTAEHMRMAHEAGSTRRAERSRARKAAKRHKRRRS